MYLKRILPACIYISLRYWAHEDMFLEIQCVQSEDYVDTSLIGLDRPAPFPFPVLLLHQVHPDDCPSLPISSRDNCQAERISSFSVPDRAGSLSLCFCSAVDWKRPCLRGFTVLHRIHTFACTYLHLHVHGRAHRPLSGRWVNFTVSDAVVSTSPVPSD